MSLHGPFRIVDPASAGVLFGSVLLSYDRGGQGGLCSLDGPRDFSSEVGTDMVILVGYAAISVVELRRSGCYYGLKLYVRYMASVVT